MKPFTLHAVLKYRRQLEDSARLELSHSLEAEARLREALDRIEGELAELHADRQQDRQVGTTVDRLLLFDNRIGLVTRQVEQARVELEKQQAQTAKKRQHLVMASKNRKVMEKLQEQQNAAYARYLDKKEMAMLDEIAVLSHERNRQ